MYMCECVSGGRRMEIVKQTCNVLASVVTTKLDETKFSVSYQENMKVLY